jgi:hypothetical protein
MPDKHLFFN